MRPIVAVLLVTLFGGVVDDVAPAHEVTVDDGTQEVETSLDITKVVQSHRRAGNDSPATILRFTIQMANPFSNRELRLVAADYDALAVGISTDADRAFERLVVIEAARDIEAKSGYVAQGSVWIPGTTGEHRWEPQNHFLGFALISRPDEKSITIDVPANVISKHRRTFRWQARTANEPRQGQVSFDYVPQDRPIRGHST